MLIPCMENPVEGESVVEQANAWGKDENSMTQFCRHRILIFTASSPRWALLQNEAKPQR
jgi:hypothetical protein